MHFFTGIFRTIILLGAVQGFTTGSLLFFSGKNRKANRLLACLIFLMALASLKLYGVEEGWFYRGRILPLIDALVPMIVIMPVGPLLYFYVQASLDPDFKLTKKDRWHFSTILIDLVPQLTAAIFITGVLLLYIPNRPGPWGLFIDTYNVYSDIPRWLSISLYLLLTARCLARLKKSADGSRPPPEALLKWLQLFVRLFGIFQVIWLVYLIPYVMPRYSDALLDTVDWYPVYVPLAILIYWLGIKGYFMSQQERPLRPKTTVAREEPDGPLVSGAVTELVRAMERDRLYLNPNLTVALVAEHTGLRPKSISAVLNRHLHKSFNEFVNEYRVRAIQERMQEENARQFTIAGLAYECGFNSLPTFQRAFKTFTGMTPKEFLSKKS